MKSKKEKNSMYKITNKMMFLGLVVFLCLSCKEKSTNPEIQSPISFSSQFSKCLSHGLAKGNGLDSIFTYSFSDNLIMDLSVIANCCPDSNRFTVSSVPGSDTLVVSAADTAQDLCNCVCLYLIHAEFNNLTKDNYIVRCILNNSSGNGEVIHFVPVDRVK